MCMHFGPKLPLCTRSAHTGHALRAFSRACSRGMHSGYAVFAPTRTARARDAVAGRPRITHTWRTAAVTHQLLASEPLRRKDSSLIGRIFAEGCALVFSFRRRRSHLEGMPRWCAGLRVLSACPKCLPGVHAQSVCPRGVLRSACPECVPRVRTPSACPESVPSSPFPSSDLPAIHKTTLLHWEHVGPSSAQGSLDAGSDMQDSP